MNKKGYEQAGVAMTCRGYAEYEKMFALAELPDFRGPVLDVASGASSFTAEANARGITAQSADPLYEMSPDEIFGHGSREIELSTRKLTDVQDSFDWSYYGSPERHRAARERSLSRFAEDYRRYQAEGRYVTARLPHLPFENNKFSFVLCSHFLFLYHDQFDFEFHLQAIRELLRVCSPGGQVRIYPLFSLQWDFYPHMERILYEVEKEEAAAQFLESKLPFIPGSDKLLSLTKQA